MSGTVRPIFTSPESIAQQTEAEIIKGIVNQFPITSKDRKYKLEISNVRVDKKVFDHADEKDAILRSKSLTYPIKGRLTLIDNQTGKVVDVDDNFSMADSFHVTGKHTVIYRGNNYAIANLLQLLPGVYTRTDNTGRLEAHYNTGSGNSFKINLDPESQMFTIKIESSNQPVAVLIRDVFGVGDREVYKYVPPEVWDKNVAGSRAKLDATINALYQRLVPRRLQNPNASIDEKKSTLRSTLETYQLHPTTTQITLGTPKTHIDAQTLLLTMKNMVDVHTGVRPEDNRDSLEFKRVQNLPDFLRTRFEKHESVDKAVRRIGFNLERIDPKDPKIKNAVPAKPFNKILHGFFLGSNLSYTPSETNPIESLESVGKVTPLGADEGGISQIRSVPLSSRNIDPSHLGIIDPSRTPESETVGIDQRFTINAYRDDDGYLYLGVLNKAGKFIQIPVHEATRSVIGFPGQEGKAVVQAQDHGKIREVPREKVDYWLKDPSHQYTVTTNLVPFINSNHPSRLTMAGKAITQALSLREREAPLVQTANAAGRPFVNIFGELISTVSPVDGVVTKVSDSQVNIKGDDGSEHKIKLVKNLPFNMKGFHDDEPTKLVQGDRVEAGQLISDNNYTKNGDLALGRNLYAAYMPYKGYNHEDGIVLSESAAKSLDSLHAYKYDYSIKSDTQTNKALFRSKFSHDFNAEQMAKLDDKGFVKPGVKLHFGDPIYALLERREPSLEERAIGNLHRDLVNPYRKVVEVWNHDEVGEVIDAHTDGKDIRIIVRSVKPLEVGDKLTGLHGNKGVVSLIVPDHEMPHSKETNKPIDILLNPASVTSRINLGQVMETAAAKIAAKTGVPYVIKNFSKENNLTGIKEELKKHGLKDTDTVVDPKTGHVYGEVFAGPQYFLKLYKTTDQNYAARNVGGYDSYLQPVKGGEEGSKAVGYMEFLGLLGSDARKNLKEIGTIKAEENTDFWDKFMRGQPLPKPRTTFATNKLFAYMKGSGINVTVSDGKIKAAPMTDKDILALSNGEIKNAKAIEARNKRPEKGGLFDFAVTGGLQGEKWSHYALAEPIVNPNFEKPVKDLLGLNQAEFEGIHSGKYSVVRTSPGQFALMNGDKKIRNIVVSRTAGQTKTASELDMGQHFAGGVAFREMLKDIDVSPELEVSKQAVSNARTVSARNDAIKRTKWLKGLSDQGFNNPSEAYVIHHLPIVPPKMRPILEKDVSTLEPADVNKLYKNLILMNTKLGELRDDLPDSDLVAYRDRLYHDAKAVMAKEESQEFDSRKEKGLMHHIAGTNSPKVGIFQNKILYKKQDFSGRATIYAAPDVGFNQAKVPREQLWTMYRMHIIRDLVKNGYPFQDATKAYANRTMAANNSFNKLTKEIPVIINRPPTLMKTNILAVYPVPVEGKTIGLNILHLPGFAADFDGDALSMYVPMTPEAIAEAKAKLLPQHHLSDARKGFGNPMYQPGHEAILGSVHLTEADSKKNPITFKSKEEALEALKDGRIESNQPIIIKP